uniref:EF-hand domain-containing protein n=1 Tax=Tetraselmis chuii TaxID=63592 RepID=A0A7S1T499_9CHLO|mmetsp:Transcript_40815/g.73346  ORF Transcript_40815/g.73346 Transcript_40815/m.73346 type:complete len:172 (+) Transcript_40815:149-664(+)|eukprot:CAMPEP_0177786084 /NCGR_PEP_ID=MMETSP0491_2-20121128/20726_1 /TAXON_ID=63592 /ORGANISM="Tetraselmis chuii, Strain PLY429" /LENGTH=171 /DNA_ID=CAMNT_0019307255 /DNA_START=122 /DNA_END=637 /DNA_ORIENTATION=-
MAPKCIFKKKAVRELKQIFDEHDKDGSGEVSVQEMKEHLKKTSGVAFSSDFTKALDKDGNGMITFKEYLMAYYRNATAADLQVMMEWVKPEMLAAPAADGPSHEQMEEFKMMFKMYDKDNDGTLDKEELMSAIKGCGFDSDEAEDMIEEFDDDKNGIFSLEEFTTMLGGGK